jgi:hypothetical protein
MTIMNNNYKQLWTTIRRIKRQKIGEDVIDDDEMSDG